MRRWQAHVTRIQAENIRQNMIRNNEVLMHRILDGSVIRNIR